MEREGPARKVGRPVEAKPIEEAKQQESEEDSSEDSDDDDALGGLCLDKEDRYCPYVDWSLA